LLDLVNIETQIVCVGRTENHSLSQYTESVKQHTSETYLDEERVALKVTDSSWGGQRF